MSINALKLGKSSNSEKKEFSDRYLVLMLGQFLKPYWFQILLVFLMLLTVTAVGLLPPYLTQLAVDGPIRSGDVNGLVTLGVVYLLTIPTTFALQFGYVYLLQTVGQNALLDLRQRLFEHILKQDMRFFNTTPVGQIVSRLSNDIEALTELFSTSIVMVVSSFVQLIGLVIAMLVLNWRMAIISLAVLPLMIGVTVFFRKRIRDASGRLHRVVADYLAFTNEQFNGMLIVQLFGRQKLSRAEFDVLNLEYKHVHENLRDSYTWFANSLQMLMAIGLAVVLYGGGQGLVAQWVTLGMVIAFIQYTRRTFTPIMMLSEQFSQIQTALAAGERIARMLKVEPQIQDPIESQSIDEAVEKSVVFEGVEFAYEADAPVIRGLTLDIPARQTIAIVGATGAGKTSLAGLLARFYDVNNGRILINGVDVRAMSHAELRKHVSVVPQSPYCFNGTIADNLRLFDPTISDEQMIQAAKTARAHDFIDKLPGKYDFMLLPSGANLSQGQRQLLALARALIHNPNSILVLDEATSNIDTETERLIQEGLTQVLANRTSIIIAHRLSTVRDADRIIVMRRGKIVEEGTHDALLMRNGVYAKLYYSQFAEQSA